MTMSTIFSQLLSNLILFCVDMGNNQMAKMDVVGVLNDIITPWYNTDAA